MATRITQEDILKINKLYKELGVYAQVARALGISASTVKRYVDPNFTEPKEKKRYSGEIKDLDPVPFRTRDWGHLCVLTDEELEGIHELWEELEL